MNKFEFHFITAFYNYFNNEISKRDYVFAESIKVRLEELIKKCDEVLDKYDWVLYRLNTWDSSYVYI